MTHGEMIAAKALRAVGTPFRLHGRKPGTALDCVGLAAHALGLRDVPTNYSLKGTYYSIIRTYMGDNGVSELLTECVLRDGDLALVQCTSRHHHLMIRASNGWVHAHAGLRRVVHMPDPSPWPITALWRNCGD